MMSLWVLVTLFTVINASLVVAGDDGDEFSNNLFSDLSPLLALFGEQFAKQFMSQSMTWMDNLIFALAPLGIITALVGAIRVGGPTWLKALIGRARENRGEAEVELMSSTSDEVSELWNGQAVVRTMGKPEIMQIVYLKDKRDLPTFGIYLVEELEHWGNDFNDQELSRRYTAVHSDGPPTFSDVEHDPHHLSNKTLSELKKYAPNISLNLSPSRSPWEAYFWAICGIIVQSAVLVVAGFATYWWTLPKGGSPVMPYAYPLTALGTILLVIGMYVCASVVEKGTKEKTWVSRKSDSGTELNDIQLLWLQKKNVVSDQCFESYAIIAPGFRKSILTSHPADSTGRGGTLSGESTTESQFLQLYESFTVLGTAITLAGFIFQFIGLRGMHWSASIAQLIATIIMTIIRAVMRRGLTIRPYDKSILHEYELDWLAVQISDPDAFWTQFTDKDGHSLDKEPHHNHSIEFCQGAVICSDEDSSTSQYSKDPLPEEFEVPSDSETDDGSTDIEKKPRVKVTKHKSHRINKVVQIRQRLGLLSKWTGPASERAISVAIAIESVMKILFPSAVKHTFTWSLGGIFKDITLTIRARQKGQWEVDTTALEAVLSLWMFHVLKKQEENASSSEKAGFKSTKRHRDWLRQGSHALRKPSIRLLCPDSKLARQNMEWWVGAAEAQVQTARFCDEQQPRKPVITFDRHHVVGYTIGTAEPLPRIPCQTETLKFEMLDTGILAEQDSIHDSLVDSLDSAPEIPSQKLLAIVSDSPLDLLLAQHIFTLFMWAICRQKEAPVAIKDDTTISHRNPDPALWNTFRLENTTLKKITQGIQQAGLGNADEAYTYIVPPLGSYKLLPEAMAVLDLARRQITFHESVSQFQHTTDVLEWLFQSCKAFRPTSPVVVKATALLIDNIRVITCTIDLWKKQQHTEVEQLVELQDRVVAQLKTADPTAVLSISKIFRKEQLEGWTAHLWQRFITNTKELEDDKLTMPQDSFLVQHEIHSSLFEHVQKTSYQGSYPRFRLSRSSRMAINAIDILERTALHYSILEMAETANSLLENGAEPNAKNLIGWTPLHYAIWMRNGQIAELLLRHRADVNCQGTDGMSPLHLAAKRGSEEMTTILIEAGAKISISDGVGRMPLHWAAMAGNKAVVTRLIKAGAPLRAREDGGRTAFHLAAMMGAIEGVNALVEANQGILNEKDEEGASALHLAAGAGHIAVVDFLVKQKSIKLNARDNLHRTALAYAVQAGQSGAVKLLLEKPDTDAATKDSTGQTPLCLAATKGDEEVVRLLLERGVDVNSRGVNGHTPLSYASQAGHEGVVKLLLEWKDVDVNTKDEKDNRTPLRWAVENCREAVVKLLLEREDIDVNSKDNFFGQTSLSYAAQAGQQGIVALLLQRRDIDVDSNSTFGETPFSLAVQYKHEAVAKKLLQIPGINVNQKDKVYFRTPLSYAAEEGHVDMVKLLLERPDIEIDAKTPALETPFFLAVKCGNEAVARLLLQSPGVDVNARDKAGQTPIVMACARGMKGIVRLLLKQPSKCDANTKDDTGSTPLAWAARMGEDKIVRVLLEYPGIEINAQDDGGRTPVWWASKYGHSAVVRVLLRRTNTDVSIRDKDGHTPLWWARKEKHETVIDLLQKHPLHARSTVHAKSW